MEFSIEMPQLTCSDLAFSWYAAVLWSNCFNVKRDRPPMQYFRLRNYVKSLLAIWFIVSNLIMYEVLFVSYPELYIWQCDMHW